MQKIKVTVSNLQTEALPKNINNILKKACKTVLQQENFNDNAEISVSFVDETEITNLNKTYRNKNSDTDVLSFPMGVNGEYEINPENNCYILGDVIIFVKRAIDQAAEYNHSLLREITFLCVHSVLHLLGYDHIKQADAKIMREKEKNIMQLLNINRD